MKEFQEPGLSQSKKVTDKLFRFLTAAFVLSIPFLATVNSVTIILILLTWLLFIRKSFHALKEVFAISMMAWIAVIGMVATNNVEEGLFRIQQKAILFVVPLVYFTADVDRAKLARIISSSFVVGISSACLYCLGDASLHWIRTGSADRFLSHGFTSSIDLYPYILATGCVLAQLILVEAKRGTVEVYGWLKKGASAWALIALLVASTFLLSVQQVILIWLLFVGYQALRFGKSRTLQAAWLAGVILLTTLAVLTIQPLREKTEELIFSRSSIPLDDEAPWTGEWNGIAIRKAIWACSWDVVKANPWFGVGTGDSQDALQEAYANRKFHLAALYNRYNAHNQFLQTLIGYGFIGFAIWMGSLAWVFQRFRSNKVFIQGLLIVCLAMLTESMLETNKGNVLTSYVMMLAVLLYPSPERAVDSPGQKMR